jgi:beta-phosphoglucomutase-like phosphatase (HAD superfamily)
MDSAVIFDVDGVLLELTPQEEDAFFRAFARRHGITGLSRDWDSYRIRNDEHIIAEILERHGQPPEESGAIVEDYLAILRDGLSGGTLTAREISGARALLASLSSSRIGIATANLLSAAKLRLEAKLHVAALLRHAISIVSGASVSIATRGDRVHMGESHLTFTRDLTHSGRM